MHPFTILLVEDEFLIRWSLQERLSEAGYHVMEAEDGRSARELFTRGCDLVLLDLKLPDADGRDLLHQFREARPKLDVVVMSAHGTPEMAKSLVREGARKFVPKPFDLDEVVRIVDGIRGEA
ncbi:MAG: response regulator [Myxococcota bacterium]